MNAYLLADFVTGRLYLAFGESCTAAAEALTATIGGTMLRPDGHERYSVGGSWPVGEPIDVSEWWPYFTNDPGCHASPIKQIRGTR